MAENQASHPEPQPGESSKNEHKTVKKLAAYALISTVGVGGLAILIHEVSSDGPDRPNLIIVPTTVEPATTATSDIQPPAPKLTLP